MTIFAIDPSLIEEETPHPLSRTFHGQHQRPGSDVHLHHRRERHEKKRDRQLTRNAIEALLRGDEDAEDLF